MASKVIGSHSHWAPLGCGVKADSTPGCAVDQTWWITGYNKWILKFQKSASRTLSNS